MQVALEKKTCLPAASCKVQPSDIIGNKEFLGEVAAVRYSLFAVR